MSKLRRFALLAIAALATAASAQTLARPGWAGSGLNAEPWWKRAVVYQLDPRSFSAEGLRGIPPRLNYLHALGVDAILLTNTSGAIDPALGTMDDLDDLIHQASSRDIRVLLELDPHAPDLPAVARLWLNHGVAGFHLPGGTPDQVADLKKLIHSVVGQRILLGDVGPDDSQKGRDPGSPELLTDPRAATVPQFTAAAVRPGVEAAQALLQAGRAIPLVLSDGPGYTRSFSRYGDGTHDIDIAKTLAAILFATDAAPLVYYGQELGLASAPSQGDAPEIHWDAPPKVKPAPGQPPPPPPPSISPNGPNAALEDADPASLLNWYRQLSALRHTNRAISSGAQIVLNHDDQDVLVWVRKPQTVSSLTPPVVVIFNLSAQPVTLSLKADMQRLHLRGSFLRSLLRSDNGMGAMHLDGMTLAPFTVYLGELRF
ncbi:alpha-amylase family protein [Edaphobacter bradus]|uniref:alpha-amylase family glycosyl hydrolase n=1 Tax=Edaphobacter bradus TaxID=2259016 RepID=UPI0021E0A8BD|nr:alpha-amylase family glycosyl hydrolase [Edaphobacter bradus]